MRLQNMVATSSRAVVRHACTRLISSVNRLSSLRTLRMSAASVTRASPAKCAILPGGMRSNHASVGPSASNAARWARRSLNLPNVAARAESFSRSKSLRRVAGSTQSRRSSRARCIRSGRAATAANMPPLTSVRIEAVIASSVV
jgi:hypothetical protein